MKNFEYIPADKLGELLVKNEVKDYRVGLQYNDDEETPATTTVLILELYNGTVLAVKLADSTEVYKDLESNEAMNLYR